MRGVAVLRRAGELACALALAAWAGCGAPAPKDTIKLGAVLSTTGTLAELGLAQLRAVAHAVEEINAAGGVLGKPLELVHHDDATATDRATRVAQALRDSGVTAVVGAVGSDLTRVVASVAVPAAVVVSASATATGLSTLDDQGYFFRTCSTDTAQAKLLAQRARQHGFTRVAVIHPPEAEEQGLADAFATAFTAGGGTVVARVAHASGQASYDELLQTVLREEPEAVVLDANPVDGTQIIKDYVAVHLGLGVFWLLSDTLGHESLVTAVGSHNFTFPHEGVGPGTPAGARYVSFASGYQARYGTEPAVGAYTANVYDAVYLLALAMEHARSTEASAIRAALPAVSLGGRAFGPADYARAVEAVRAGQDINYDGASGPVDLNTVGDTTAPFDVWVVRDGVIVVVERAVLAPP
ncbi:MAG: ABC transporter substrate-binding protein [Myxococcota bacterium]